jgi:hypothetical protein
MVERLMNNELERMWKETVLAFLRHLSIRLQGLKEAVAYFRIFGVYAEIRTEYHQNWLQTGGVAVSCTLLGDVN